MSRKAPTLTQLQSIWYKKLEESGFVDIENVKDPTRPLTEWHSFKFTSYSTQVKKVKREIYQTKIDSFANSQEFSEIINLIVKHGNSRFSDSQVVMIWEMHRNGHTERGIAEEMRCSKSCIHFLLHRIKTWMTLVA